MTDPATRQLMLTGAGFLDLGRNIDGLSRPMTLLAFAGLLTPLVVPVPLASWLALLASGMAGLCAAYAGARVAFDAALFRGLAEGTGDLAPLDDALLQLGLMPASKAGRPSHERLAGAQRLLRRQALLLAAQAGALIIAGALATAVA